MGLIETETAKERLRRWIQDCTLIGDSQSADLYRDFIDFIDKQPTVDAAPVVHGRWIWSPEYCKFICSVCAGREGECETPICKWCGARMDAKEGRSERMSNKKYTEMTDAEIKQHLDDTAEWLSKMGYDGDAIMRPELQHINEQNAEIERIEAENADLRAQLAAEKKRADAAVKDITHICRTCKHAYANRGEHCRVAHYEKNNLRCKNWEWRGDHGTEGER